MKWNIPNQLTVGRVFLSAGFFILLSFYDAAAPLSRTLMGAGFVVFVVAGITDFLDGYLARRLNQTSTFGRIVDPIVDKVLVVGAFAMLSGPGFVIQPELVGPAEQALPHWLTGGMVSALQPWMIVVILAREFIISGIRSYSESQGRQFPAIPIGKLKMLCQSMAVGSILFCLAWTPFAVWSMWFKIIAVWLSVFLTVLSGFIYIFQARGLLRDDGRAS